MTLPLLLLLSLRQLAIGATGPLPAPTAPAGLEVELRTAGNKTTFQLSEVVPLEVAFRTSKPSTYSIEIADGWNAAPAADRFFVEPATSVIDREVWWLRGYACCDTRRAFLGSAPAVYSYELTDHLRFTEPGQYRIQYATRRVFTGPLRRAYEPSDLLVRSNVLTITITKDDPRWADEVLPGALDGVKAPPLNELRRLDNLPLPGSLEPRIPSSAMVRYRRAYRELRLLDTPDAIRARVASLRLPSVEQWRKDESYGGTSGIDNALAYSSRPDLVAAALRERAAAPDFGIMRGYFDLWIKVLLERDHPELVRLGRPDRTRLPETAGTFQRIAQVELRDTLRELQKAKTGVAAEITAATLRQVERDLSKP